MRNLINWINKSTLKTGRFIKGFYYKLLNPFKLLHERICLSDVKPYLLFRDWLLDAIQYGLIATLVYSVFLGFQGWKTLSLILGFGFGMWIIGETIGRIKKVIG